jgi:hypothetical protein
VTNTQKARVLRRILQAGLAGVALLIIAMIVSYAQRMPPIPTEFESVPASTDPDEDTKRISVAIKERRYVEAFKLALSVNKQSQNASSSMLIAGGHSTGILGAYREDHCKAVVWYDRAARFNRALPAIYTSMHYLAGQGVKRDMEAAYFWYLRAAFLIKEYPRQQLPDLDYPRYVRGLELALEKQFPTLSDPKIRNAITEKLSNRKLEDQASPVPQSTPDIPVLGAYWGKLMYGSSGCYGPQAREFDWFDSQFRAERAGFQKFSNDFIGNAMGLNVQF